MTVFIHEPDGADEPTIWVLEGGDTDDYQYTHLFSRIDLDPDARRFWPDVVARMTGTTITNDEAAEQLIAQTISEQGGDPGSSIHSWRCEYPDRYGNCDCVEQAARAILAALTGVPHD